MTSELTPKFSAEELHGCKNWLLPDVSSNKSLPSAEKEALDAKKKQIKRNEKKGPPDNSIGESIEVVEELVAPITAEQLQEITEAAEKEGYDEGYQKGLENGLKAGKEKGEQEGFAAGMEQSKETVTAQCEQLQHVIDALLIPLESEQKQLQDMILDMVSSLANAVVLRELKLDSAHITQLVDDALNTIPIGADKFSLFLNSQDIDIVEKHLAYFQHNDDKHLSLQIDDTLLPGGCRLETQQTVVDYTVEQRLQKVIDGFLHKRFSNNNKDEKQIEDKLNENEQGANTNVESEKVEAVQLEESEETPVVSETVAADIKTDASTDNEKQEKKVQENKVQENKAQGSEQTEQQKEQQTEPLNEKRLNEDALDDKEVLDAKDKDEKE